MKQKFPCSSGFRVEMSEDFFQGKNGRPLQCVDPTECFPLVGVGVGVFFFFFFFFFKVDWWQRLACWDTILFGHFHCLMALNFQMLAFQAQSGHNGRVESLACRHGRRLMMAANGSWLVNVLHLISSRLVSLVLNFLVAKAPANWIVPWERDIHKHFPHSTPTCPIESVKNVNGRQWHLRHSIQDPDRCFPIFMKMLIWIF